jgi:hypothetical protein
MKARTGLTRPVVLSAGVLPCCRHVARHLFLESIDIVERSLLAQPLDEFDAHRESVEVLVYEIDQVGLDAPFGYITEVRVDSDADRSCVSPFPRRDDRPACVHTVGGGALSRYGRQVRSRVAELATPAITFYDRSFEGRWSAEQVRSSPHVTGGDQLPDTRGGDPGIVGAEDADGGHLETGLRARAPKEVDIPFPVRSEPKILSDRHGDGPQSLDEDLGDESLGIEQGESRVEAKDHDLLCPGLAQQTNTLGDT